MFRYRFIAAGFCLVLSSASAYAQPGANAQYEDCTRRVAADAREAFKYARAWYGQSRSMAAQHCMALAHFELKEYREAAEMLDAIISRVPPSQGVLWLTMRGQAAKAHLAAGNPDAARAHLDEGLLWALDKSLDVQTVPLLTQRALLFDQQRAYLKALQDLDHALEILPSNPIMLQRAEIYLKLDMKSAARKDIEFVLRQEPSNAKARELLTRTGG